MKILKNIKLLFISSLLFVGCNEEDFLEQINPNATTTDTFWQSEKQFNSALTTAYAALQFQSISGGEYQYEMILGDIAGTESWYRPAAFRNLTYNDGSYYVSDKWNELYVGIFRANQVIQYIETADASIFSGNSKNEIEGQARFLRAYFYFQLAHTYGGAVMHTKVAETKEDLLKPFSTIDEVTNSIILPDLEFAQANLPISWNSDSDTGRITWGATTSLLGKVHLFGENWSEAATQLKAVITKGGYNLTADIMDNFSHENEFNEESIFEVAYSADLNPGVPGAAVDDNTNESGAEASTLARALGQLNFGAYNTLLPSYYLHELYVNDQVDPTNSVNDGNTHSKRMTATICPQNGESLYYNIELDSPEAKGWAFGQSAYIKKHTNWYHLDAEDNLSRSGINFRHIRLSDVYLMYAEAVLNATGDISTAITYIDMVRSRAGVVTLKQYMDNNSNTFPQLHVSIQVHGAQPYVAASVETVMTHIQRVERPLELAFEGHRWKDLVRWGIVAEVFNDLYADEVWRNENQDILEISENGVAPLFIKERIRPDFLLSSQNYNSSQHDYLPIPTGEVQTNPQL